MNARVVTHSENDGCENDGCHAGVCEASAILRALLRDGEPKTCGSRVCERPWIFDSVAGIQKTFGDTVVDATGRRCVRLYIMYHGKHVLSCQIEHWSTVWCKNINRIEKNELVFVLWPTEQLLHPVLPLR